MFPFTLTGPQFLVFYAGLAVLLLLAYRRVQHAATGSDDAGVMLDALTADPYCIACLRDGPDEAVRVAVVNLIDRGLLVQGKGSGWRASLQGDPAVQRRPLDAAILGQCKAASMSPDDIMADRTVRKAAVVLEAHLQSQGLLQDAPALVLQARVRMGVLLLLAGLALARIAQAVLAGRNNITLLVILAVVACIAALSMKPARLTGKGRRSMSTLEGLLGRLKGRSDGLRPGGATNEAVLFAAVFGIHALPASAFAFVEETYPRPRPSSDSGGGGDGGSSSSDSGGSSCGGGGGCGGCGGGGGD